MLQSLGVHFLATVIRIGNNGLSGKSLLAVPFLIAFYLDSAFKEWI
jgi:hypothetical protein